MTTAKEYASHTPERKAAIRATWKNWYHRGIGRHVDNRQKERARRWAEFFHNYGEKCQTCGHDNIKHLTIAHIGGFGKVQRKELNIKGGLSQLRILRRAGWPKEMALSDGTKIEIGVQCWNCNSSELRYPDWEENVKFYLTKAKGE